MFDYIINCFKLFWMENEVVLMCLGVAVLFITIMVITDYTPGNVAHVRGNIDDIFND